VVFVQNGVDLETFGSAQPECPRGDRPRVLYVGLLTPRKGVVDLIDASRQLLEQGVDHELWIVGGTPDEGQVAEQAVRRSAHPGVVFRGTRQPEEMPSVYAAADVFCLPSWWEAMPLSVLEAMAAGLPVVATDVGDVKEAVSDGSSGILVPPRSPDRLASALRELLLDAGRRADLGGQARRTALTHFSSRSAVDATDDLYHQLADGHS